MLLFGLPALVGWLVSRRHATAAALASAALASPASHATTFNTQTLQAKTQNIHELTRAANQLRNSLAIDAPMDAPDYKKTTQRMKQETEKLYALQKDMEQLAPSLDLSDDLKQRANLQPLLLKGHLLELQEALASKSFDTYVSKSTKKTYLGGKVERELEEICETAEYFLSLVDESNSSE